MGEEGLRMVSKLKFEHIALTSFSKMREDVAAQVSMHVAYLRCIIIMCTFQTL